MIAEILKPYKKIIIVFLITISIIIIIGYAFIFDYYKDVHKDNYIIVTCQDQETGEVYEEQYKNNQELEDSGFLCGDPIIENPLYPNIKFNITIK